MVVLSILLVYVSLPGDVNRGMYVCMTCYCLHSEFIPLANLSSPSNADRGMYVWLASVYMVIFLSSWFTLVYRAMLIEACMPDLLLFTR